MGALKLIFADRRAENWRSISLVILHKANVNLRAPIYRLVAVKELIIFFYIVPIHKFVLIDNFFFNSLYVSLLLLM